MQPEVIEVSNTQISCDGGKENFGHPKIYLNLGETRKVVCPYCSKIFVHKDLKIQHGRSN